MKNKVFFIAEISANHCGNFKLAKNLIKCAYVNSADAVKLPSKTRIAPQQTQNHDP